MVRINLCTSTIFVVKIVTSSNMNIFVCQNYYPEVLSLCFNEITLCNNDAKNNIIWPLKFYDKYHIHHNTVFHILLDIYQDTCNTKMAPKRTRQSQPQCCSQDDMITKVSPKRKWPCQRQCRSQDDVIKPKKNARKQLLLDLVTGQSLYFVILSHIHCQCHSILKQKWNIVNWYL